jgi:hypothetical protein
MMLPSKVEDFDGLDLDELTGNLEPFGVHEPPIASRVSIPRPSAIGSKNG